MISEVSVSVMLGNLNLKGYWAYCANWTSWGRASCLSRAISHRLNITGHLDLKRTTDVEILFTGRNRAFNFSLEISRWSRVRTALSTGAWTLYWTLNLPCTHSVEYQMAYVGTNSLFLPMVQQICSEGKYLVLLWSAWNFLTTRVTS